MVPKYPKQVQVAKTMPKAIFQLQRHHYRLKDDQTGKQGQILVFKF